MRFLVFAALVLTSSPSAAMTAQELMPSCQAVPDVPLGAPMILPVAATPCWWYLGAFHDLQGVNDVPGASVLGTCPVRATFTDAARLFVRYVRAHPKVAKERAALGALLALREAYPCPAK